MNAPARISEPMDDEGRVIATLGPIVASAQTPIGAACAFLRHGGNALVHQFARRWEGHEVAAAEHERQARWHREQARKLMPIARRAR